MATKTDWKERVAGRLRQLLDLKGWSLGRLSRETKGRLSKSQLGNYSQGTRLPGPEEATIIAAALGESPAHILCLDDDMPALSKIEAKLIGDFRALPEDQRAAFAQRIELLAAAYRVPIPTERVLETGFNPARRPAPKPKAKPKAGTQ